MEKYFQGQRVNIPKINTNLEVRKALGALSKALEGRARADEAREEEASSRSRRIAPSGWIPARISVARVPRMQPLQRPMVRPRGLCQNASSPTLVFRRETCRGSGCEGRGKKVAAIVIRIIREGGRELNRRRKSLREISRALADLTSLSRGCARLFLFFSFFFSLSFLSRSPIRIGSSRVTQFD